MWYPSLMRTQTAVHDDMGKSYSHIHKALAETYKTFPEVIEYIRCCHGGLGLSRREMALRNHEKVYAMASELNRVIHHLLSDKATEAHRYQNLQDRKRILYGAMNRRRAILNFLMLISDEQFTAITSYNDSGIEKPS